MQMVSGIPSDLSEPCQPMKISHLMGMVAHARLPVGSWLEQMCRDETCLRCSEDFSETPKHCLWIYQSTRRMWIGALWIVRNVSWIYWLEILLLVTGRVRHFLYPAEGTEFILHIQSGIYSLNSLQWRYGPF